MSFNGSFNGQLLVDNRPYQIEVKDGVITSITSVTAQQAQARGTKAGVNQDGQDEQTMNERVKQIELDKVFKAKLQSVLTDNMYERKLPKRKRGKLDMHNLWRGSVGSTNLFVQKQARKGRHYNVCLVVDKSGSMFGERLNQATETAVFLGKHFEAINIDYSIIGFADRAQIIKPINQALSDDLVAELANRQHSLGNGTQMPEGIKLAISQLKNQTGQSLLIVISDGETSGAKEVKAMLHANANIKAFGVGIGTPVRCLPQAELIDDIDQLKPVILNWLAQNIRRGA